jgi:hypothetical protein
MYKKLCETFALLGDIINRHVVQNGTGWQSQSSLAKPTLCNTPKKSEHEWRECGELHKGGFKIRDIRVQKAQL